MKTAAFRLIAVVSIGVVLTLTTDVFLTPANLLNVLRQASLTFLIASGLTLTILTAGLDLSVGANREAARLSGVPVRARLNLVYILSGAMAGLAALVYLARLNSAEADIGEPLTLPAIAAVLVGGTSLFGGAGSLTGTLIGALTLVLNGMNLLAVDANWQPLVTGVIVILAVWIDLMTRQRSEAKT